MSRGRRYICSAIFFLLVVFSQRAYSQQTIRSSLFQADSVLPSVRIDSIVAISPPQTKSATVAVVLSAVLPGAGQIYTARYWKIPIIWGFGYYFGSVWVKANNSYKDARDRYQLSLQGGGEGDAQARYERDFYHDERDRFAFYLALTYLLNLVDAYVGASLYNFDVSDDLGGNAELRLRIPLR